MNNTIDFQQIKRGEIYLADLGTHVEGITSGLRPILVISNNRFIRSTPVVQVLPITTRCNDFILHFRLNNSFLKKISYVECEQLLTIQKKQLIKYIGTVTDMQLEVINNFVHMAIGD